MQSARNTSGRLSLAAAAVPVSSGYFGPGFHSGELELHRGCGAPAVPSPTGGRAQTRRQLRHREPRCTGDHPKAVKENK